MPLEIRQIAIQLRVAEDPGEADAPTGPRSIMELCDCDDEGDAEEKETALVERCVEAVLAELARRGEW